MVADYFDNNQTVIDQMAELGQVVQSKQFHTVCPLQTFYFEKQRACFSQPINEAILAVFPYQGKDGQLAWLFSVEYSAVLNETILGQLQLKWDSDDYFVS